MATPSPPPSPQAPPPPPPPPPLSQSPSNPKPLAIKKPQPVPWTHQETIHLIQAYQEKWYSLKRGQLKASQWEEVAVTVAAKCGYDDYSNPSAKSAIQCRHKMEKLRKRYRTEKQGGATVSSTSWQYFHLMDCLQRGPLPISSRPIDDYEDGNNDDGGGGGGEEDEDEDEEEEEDEDEEKNYVKSRSINYILRRPTFVNRFSEITRGGSVKRARIVEAEEVGEEGKRGRKVGMELAAEIRGFAERFVGMEKRKIEMMKETERCRMEMENKRIKMIMDSQRKICDMIDMAFGSSNNKIKLEQHS